MATRRRPWPNSAEWARLDCITLARSSRKALSGEVDHIQDVALLRKIVKVVENLTEIETKLKECKEKEMTNGSA